MGVLAQLAYVIDGRLQADIKRILCKLEQERKLMAAGIEEMDAALAQIDAQLSGIQGTLVELDKNSSKLVDDIRALKAKVSPDLQAQVDRILKNATALSDVSASLSTAVSQVAAADAEATS